MRKLIIIILGLLVAALTTPVIANAGNPLLVLNASKVVDSTQCYTRMDSDSGYALAFLRHAGIPFEVLDVDTLYSDNGWGSANATRALAFKEILNDYNVVLIPQQQIAFESWKNKTRTTAPHPVDTVGLNSWMIRGLIDYIAEGGCVDNRDLYIGTTSYEFWKNSVDSLAWQDTVVGIKYTGTPPITPTAVARYSFIIDADNPIYSPYIDRDSVFQMTYNYGGTERVGTFTGNIDTVNSLYVRNPTAKVLIRDSTTTKRPVAIYQKYKKGHVIQWLSTDIMWLPNHWASSGGAQFTATRGGGMGADFIYLAPIRYLLALGNPSASMPMAFTAFFESDHGNAFYGIEDKLLAKGIPVSNSAIEPGNATLGQWEDVAELCVASDIYAIRWHHDGTSLIPDDPVCLFNCSSNPQGGCEHTIFWDNCKDSLLSLSVWNATLARMAAIETPAEAAGTQFEQTADGHGNVGWRGYMSKGSASSAFAAGYCASKGFSMAKVVLWDFLYATLAAITDSVKFKNEFKYRFDGYQNGWNPTRPWGATNYMTDTSWSTWFYPSPAVYKGYFGSGGNWEKWQQPTTGGFYMQAVERTDTTCAGCVNTYDTLWYADPAQSGALDAAVRKYLGWAIDYARNSYAPFWWYTEQAHILNMDGGDYETHWADQVHFVDSLLRARGVIYTPRMWQDRANKYRNWVSIANYRSGPDYVKFTMRDTSSTTFAGTGYNWFKNTDGTRTIPVNLTYEVSRVDNLGNYKYETVVVPQFTDSLVCYSVWRPDEGRWYHSPGRKLSSGMITKSSRLFAGDKSLVQRGYYSGWF